jgi:hypothetical protein
MEILGVFKMLITKPTVVEILSVQPNYSNPRYSDFLLTTIDEAYLLFGPYIKDIPEDNQLMALGYAVCHLFTIQCWADQGYPGVPTNLSSRNSSVKFAEGKHGIFSGSNCGEKLRYLINNYKKMGVYVAPKADCC